MLDKLFLNLQLFGEGGGDGGDGSSGVGAVGGTAGDGNSGEKEIPASIPEKAKKYYEKAMQKSTFAKASDDTAQAADVQTTAEARRSYADLIKSDEYRDEHKAYMDKAIGDRLKKYKGIEENLSKHKALLETVAHKYGLDPDSENYLQELEERIAADDSYYEDYAMEHNISTEEARRIVAMERKVAKFEEQEAEARKQEQMRQQIMVLRQNAQKTKAQFPGFDLDLEMQSEQFRRLCATNNGDTTAAYMACHWKEILPATVQMASRQIQAQTANAVASNSARPIENGISSNAPSVVENDFRNMSLNDLRKYADEQRRKKQGK